MFILDLLLAFLYIVGVIILVIVVIALAIPLGLLYGIYWLIFKSGRPRKKTKKSISKKRGPKFDKSNIATIVNKAIHAKDDESFDAKKFNEEVKEYVEQVKDVQNK